MNMDNAISPDSHHSNHNSGGAAAAFLYIWYTWGLWAFAFAFIFIMLLCSRCSYCDRPIVPKPETKEEASASAADDDASPSAADDSAGGGAAPIQVVIQRDALTFHQLKDAATASSCTICLADYRGGEDVRVMPECCHVFHRSCIDVWLRIHATCPDCRNPTPLPPK